MADRFDDLMNDFWNARQEGTSPDPGALDPGLAGAIEQLHTLSQAPIADSARERIARQVFAPTRPTKGDTLVSLDVAALPLPHLNGHSPAPVLRLPASRRKPRRNLQNLMMVAAALLLVVTGIGGYFTNRESIDRLLGINAIQTPGAVTAPVVDSGWPQFRGGASRTGYSSDPGPGGELNLRWTFTADEDLGSVVADSGWVYVYGRNGGLYALDSQSGEQRWAVDLSPNVYDGVNRWPTPAVLDGVIFTGTKDGNIIALDTSTGAVIWQRAISTGQIESSFAAVDDALYLSSPDGVLAIDPASGETIWSWTGEVDLSIWSAAVGGGLLYVSDSAGTVVAIDISTGQTAWVAKLGGAHRNPAYRDGTVYVGHVNGSFYALDATDGTVRWTSEAITTADQTMNPVVTPQALIAAWANGPVRALDLASGEVLWEVEGPKTSFSPYASVNAVYSLSRDGANLVAYDLTSGAELGRTPVSNLGLAAISGDTLVAGTFDDSGVVSSFSPGTGEPVAQTAGPTTAIAPVTPVAESAEVVTATAVPTVEPEVAAEVSFEASQVELVWSTTGSESTPMSGPLDIEIAPNGNIYVIVEGRGSIQVFAPDGAFIEEWGSRGSGPGQFMSAGSFGFDADGNIFVFDTGNHRVQKFAPDHTFILEWGSLGNDNGQFNEVQGAVDAERGLVYVAEFLNNRIQVFDLDGNFLDKWGSAGAGDGQFFHPASIRIDADGNVYVGEDGDGSRSRVQVFDPSGRWLATFGQDYFTSAWGFAFDGNGNFYGGDVWRHRIVIFAPDHTFIGSIDAVEGIDSFGQMYGFAFDDEGYLYVSDYDNGRLMKLKLPPMP